jgi:hypothetical protein
MELGDGGIEAGGTINGIPPTADDGQRKQETRYEQAARFARVVLKVDRDRQRAILLARRRVQRMVWAAEQ